jgi:hypothetical protein
MDNSLTRFIQFATTKSRLYWISIAIAFFAILFLINIVINYTIVMVKVVSYDGITTQPSIYSSTNGQSEEPVITVGELAIVKRSTLSLHARAGSYETSKSIPSLPVIGFSTVSINLYKDHDVQKYSGDSLGCIAYDHTTDHVLSYSCTNPKNLVFYDRPSDEKIQWENKLVAQITPGFPPIYSIHPFRNGVLGLLQPSGGDEEANSLLFSVDSSGNKQLYNLPNDFNLDDIGSTNVVTDTSVSDNGKFLLVTGSGTIYLGEISGKNVAYKSLSVSNKYDSSFDTLVCTLVTTTAYCYFGPGSEESDSAIQTTHDKTVGAGTIQVIDFSNDTASSKIYSFPAKQPIDTLLVTESKNLYGLVGNVNGDPSKHNLYKLGLNGDNVSVQPFLTNINSVGSGNGLVYIKDNAVYKINDATNEAYLVFVSPHLRLSNIVTIEGNTFINGYVNDVPDGKLHTYKILNRPATAAVGKRLVDIVPFYIKGPVLSMDYSDDAIRIRVFATPTSFASTGKTTYDAGEYAANRQQIENYLMAAGITSNNYNIVYTY